MKTNTQPQRAYVVIMWDKADSTVGDVVVQASNPEEAKRAALRWKFEDADQIMEDEEPDDTDGSKNGHLPILALDKEGLDDLYSRVKREAEILAAHTRAPD